MADNSTTLFHSSVLYFISFRIFHFVFFIFSPPVHKLRIVANEVVPVFFKPLFKLSELFKMFGICAFRNSDNHIHIGADMIYDFHRKAEIIGRNVFPFLVQRHIPKICSRLHFHKFGTFAYTLPLLLRKKNVFAFCSFRKNHSPILLSNIGVLGAAALNKPTAEPVGKKVYFFCTCDNQANPLCKHNSSNAFTSFLTEDCRSSFPRSY